MERRTFRLRRGAVPVHRKGSIVRDNFPKRSNLRRRYFARGVTLIELMIALLLSLLIIAAVGYIYVGNRAAFRTQTADSRTTDSARVAI